ncbi:MAG: hypothetical protein WA001_03105 [Patescibacteria group bacterium]
MTLPPPLTLAFWAQTQPPALLPLSTYIVLAIMVALVIVGIVAAVMRMRSRRDKLASQLLGRASALLITMGLAGLVLYAFSYESIVYLSMHVWWVLWLIIAAIWASGIIRFGMVDIPKARAAQAEKEKFEKWLPKKKK